MLPASSWLISYCAGGSHPPVTVVLINNGGGGIFDFLPISSEVPEDTFVELWSTPQNVDLAGKYPSSHLFACIFPQ